MIPGFAAPTTNPEWRDYLPIAHRHALRLAYKYHICDANEVFGKIQELALAFSPKFDPSFSNRFDSWIFGKVDKLLKTECSEAAASSARSADMICTSIKVSGGEIVSPDVYDESLLCEDLTDRPKPAGLSKKIDWLLTLAHGGADEKEMAARGGVTVRRIRQAMQEVLDAANRAAKAGQGDLFSDLLLSTPTSKKKGAA